ncbi:uncharacterized protein LOC122948382 [Acropora millepora]|uniref:uncharacterized protein LOC122948382 n=1 Tax=Acropora millepora TaxID=45264 RepID=UPI001CF240B1|nr:uncharacterized protein LOC122948382 [Acropora millepora]
MANPTSSPYDQKSKKKSRSELIEHAVKCLTTERSTSVCVKQEHVDRVWKQLLNSGKAGEYFTNQERQEIEEEIGFWEEFHDSQVQTRRPSDLRVCYLCGDNPINDLEVFRANGVLYQNVWAIEKDSKVLEKAYDAIKKAQLRNVRLFKGDILRFFEKFPDQFDIIYLDACGALPSDNQKTLKIIGYVFQYDKLTSPGALITNFSFPPQQENTASSEDDDKEREMINFLVKEYMKYRLCNVLGKDNSPENNAKYLSGRTDEDNYGDYVSFQVIDSAYLFTPAQRMLSSNDRDESLWGQIFSSKQDFLDKINSYNEKSTETTTNQKLMELREDLKKKCKVHVKSSLFFNLRKMAETFHKKSKDYSCCKAWIRDIFPDWKSKSFLKDKYAEIPMLLTPLLFSSPAHIIDFSNYTFASRCLEPLFKAVADGTFPSCCDMTTPEQATCLAAGLLYGQMAHPSFPVMDKLFRLSYISKTRQMFADVFVFDKCRYMYDQFPSVDYADFAIEEPKQQMVFRMVVDGFRKHLGGICSEDLFKFCDVASVPGNAIAEGEVFLRSIPERQKIVSEQ